ncbi:Attractin-like protein 1 [Liparis tanakae]|uniref:Attractin-like protein 1 n=1 Tax=Liparis tanakae TaxID=230148 RepID=A0A4Z2FF10_9TELE|nr:Attractin-like protein 1 [Liparis tanakae]
MATPEQANKNLDMSINASNNFNLNITWSLSSTAGTISGEEMPLIARTNIKEHRDSFSCEKFNFRLHHNITFYVYVSNFSWPIKIQGFAASSRPREQFTGSHVDPRCGSWLILPAKERSPG